jgi:hypothetical protein
MNKIFQKIIFKDKNHITDKLRLAKKIEEKCRSEKTVLRKEFESLKYDKFLYNNEMEPKNDIFSETLNDDVSI